MRTLTDRERRSLVEEFHAESGSDLVGLWEIAKEVEELVGTGETAREQSLMVVRDLLAKGLIAGDPPYSPGGFKAWNDQVPDNVMARIHIEWLSLGHTPNIPDIVWFCRRE
jgi:hypothetical protein